jgi:hypothetical protein
MVLIAHGCVIRVYLQQFSRAGWRTDDLDHNGLPTAPGRFPTCRTRERLNVQLNIPQLGDQFGDAVMTSLPHHTPIHFLDLNECPP